ncbi:MAG: T9SS type A sorting domain-containing protein [Bacteroidetes bacterium]|nr:T9SS type A sorting domain-containing protein [Bacteroidota bacterium]
MWDESATNLNVNVIPAGSCGTGINQSTNEPSFSIFPNPTDEAIHITGNNLSGNNYTYSLYNTIGQLLQYENLLKSNNEIETEINLAAFPSGVYLLQISSEGYSNSLKIFKK